MDDYNQRRFERLIRVETFGRENLTDFSSGGQAYADFGAVSTHIKNLNEAKAGQRPARKSKEALRAELLEALKDIARTARAIDQQDPGFAVAYRLPDDRTERNLLTCADAVLGHLEVVTKDTEGRPADSPEVQAAKLALQAKFHSFEAPADFVVHLRDDLDALRGTTGENQQQTQGGMENTAFIDAELSLATATVQRLDTSVRNRYSRQPEKIATWSAISRVHRGPRPVKSEEEVAGGSAPPAAAAAPVPALAPGA